MRIKDRLQKIEKSVPCPKVRVEFTQEQQKEIAQNIFGKSDSELEGGMFTPGQLRRIAERHLRSLTQ